MCGQDDAGERTLELREALASVADRWNAVQDPWTAVGPERRDLRRAVMAARMQGTCWGDIGALVGTEKESLKSLFGCMPRYGRRHEGDGAHDNGGHGGCSGHGHEHDEQDSDGGRTYRSDLGPVTARP